MDFVKGAIMESALMHNQEMTQDRIAQMDHMMGNIAAAKIIHANI